jgi:hypothetical protein
MTNFWVKSTKIPTVWVLKNPLSVPKKIIYNFMIFLDTKNGKTKNSFSSSFFGAVVGSGINIPGPQHR